jgi:RNA polymerase sigma-70 factor (ECF subfamily)
MQEPRARLTELFHRHAADIRAYARWRVGDADADDVVGEVWLVAWQSLESVRPDGERAWLFGVARRVVLARHRQHVARVALTSRLSAEHDRSVVDVAEHVVFTDRVRQVLDELSDADRELLVTATWFDLSSAEAAKVLGVTRATYAVRLHRARGRFRAAFRTPSEARTGPYPMSVREGAR